METETTIPADLLLVRGRCIANVVMLLVESTPLREESIQLWGADAQPDVDGAHKNAVLFGDTKVLQSSPGEHPTSVSSAPHLQLYIYCINVCYIYIFNYILFFHWVCPYTTARY